ncbi:MULTISPECIES: DUF4136 domain-containing protein [Flavobacteriaceae]|uniref:DUF4136 domain-containing protein n=1 Tax=Flavobacteriaceae TaxID=49546 RepID=UPI0010AEB4C2|nr:MULTISPECIES: DUF4136 domain-containing protein [Flavobacteriaceae]NJB37213.1 DUF4136 domain-containing protein [Croceivirga sp. JEA036]TKD59302.1 DUF4136 domain-containing protein [Flavobacterium sp. ASW18X]
MKRVLLLLIVIVFASCAGTRVVYDYDETTNFTNYARYTYYPEMESGLSQLDEKRLLRVLDSTLLAKGFIMAEEPDFYVNVSSSSYRTPPQNNVGVGVGGTGRNVGGGISIGLPIGNSGMQRSIQFDFVDVAKDQLFWQAIAEQSFRDNASPSVREQQLKAVVDKVFKKFPPYTK